MKEREWGKNPINFVVWIDQMTLDNGLLTICEHIDGVRNGIDVRVGGIVYEGSYEMIHQKHSRA